jgi:hypothetical protein
LRRLIAHFLAKSLIITRGLLFVVLVRSAGRQTAADPLPPARDAPPRWTRGHHHMSLTRAVQHGCGWTFFLG